MTKKKKSLAALSLSFSGLFEAEILVELLLRFYHHPLADDKDFCINLLENAAEALRLSVKKEKLLEDVPPEQMNLIAAMWFVEWNAISSFSNISYFEERRNWLEKIRRAIPSCFCNQEWLI